MGRTRVVHVCESCDKDIARDEIRVDIQHFTECVQVFNEATETALEREFRIPDGSYHPDCLEAEFRSVLDKVIERAEAEEETPE